MRLKIVSLLLAAFTACSTVPTIEKGKPENHEELFEHARQLQDGGRFAEAEELYLKIEKDFGSKERLSQDEDGSGDEGVAPGETYGDAVRRELPILRCRKQGVSQKWFSSPEKLAIALKEALTNVYGGKLEGLLDCQPYVTSGEKVYRISPPREVVAWILDQRKKAGVVLPLTVEKEVPTEGDYLLECSGFRDHPHLVFRFIYTDDGWVWNSVYKNTIAEMGPSWSR